jgi:hypothetical protein
MVREKRPHMVQLYSTALMIAMSPSSFQVSMYLTPTCMGKWHRFPLLSMMCHFFPSFSLSVKSTFVFTDNSLGNCYRYSLFRDPGLSDKYGKLAAGCPLDSLVLCPISSHYSLASHGSYADREEESTRKAIFSRHSTHQLIRTRCSLLGRVVTLQPSWEAL